MPFAVVECSSSHRVPGTWWVSRINTAANCHRILRGWVLWVSVVLLVHRRGWRLVVALDGRRVCLNRWDIATVLVLRVGMYCRRRQMW